MPVALKKLDLSLELHGLRSSLKTPILIESFDNVAGYTSPSNAVVTLDTVNKFQGTGAMRMKAAADTSTTVFATKTLEAEYDPSTWDVCAWLQDPDILSVNNTNMQIGRSGSFGGVTVNLGADDLPRGKQWVARNVSEMGAIPSGVGPVQLRPRIGSKSGRNADVMFDSFVAQAKGTPTIIFTFDDGYASQLSVAKPILDAKNMPAVLFVPPNLIGNAGRQTWDDIRTCDAAGWDIACDSMGDQSFASFGDPAGGVANWQEVKAALLAQSINPRALDILCWPNGEYTRVPPACDTADMTTNGTTNIVFATATANPPLVGMTMKGFNVPANTIIDSVTDATHFTVTNVVPAGITRAKFIDESGVFYGRKLVDAFSAAGAKLGRTTRGGSQYTRFGFAEQGMMLIGQGVTGASLATIKTYVDECILRGTTLTFYFHSVTEAGGGINIATAVFQGLIDYVYGFVQAGQAVVTTLSQLYARDANGFPF